MNLTIANISTQIGVEDFQAVVAAIGRQVTGDFQPEWGVSANLSGTSISIGNERAPIQGNHDAIIYLGDASQDPTTGVSGALGYHSRNYANIPYGFVYLDICAQYDEVWSCTLSHEVLELLGDPDAAMTVTGPSPNGSNGTVYYDLEVCDPTQGDSYNIDNVVVSNFVGRSYFGLTGGSGSTNHLNLSLVPFGVRPKGYFQYEVNGATHQIQGALVTERQLAAKRLMKNGRRNERRRERLLRSSSHPPTNQLFNLEENMSATQQASPSSQPPVRSLRETLAINGELRRRAQQAAAIAALNVIKEAGITITPADVAEAQADLAEMSKPIGGIIEASTATDVAAVGNTVISAIGLGVALGF